MSSEDLPNRRDARPDPRQRPPREFTYGDGDGSSGVREPRRPRPYDNSGSGMLERPDPDGPTEADAASVTPAKVPSVRP